MEQPIGFELLKVGNTSYRFELKNGEFIAVHEILDIDDEEDLVKYSKLSYIFLGGKGDDVRYKACEIKISDIKEIQKIHTKIIK